MMQREMNLAFADEPFGERTAVVRAGGRDCEDLAAALHQHDRVVAEVAEERDLFAQLLFGDADGEIRTDRTGGLRAHARRLHAIRSAVERGLRSGAAGGESRRAAGSPAGSARALRGSRGSTRRVAST